jgi:hypothetical protein
MQNLTGRPTKLTKDRARTIVRDIRDGASRRAAARRAGVSLSTLMNWLYRGREGEPGYRGFANRIEAATLRADYLRSQGALIASIMRDPSMREDYLEHMAWIRRAVRS